MTLIYKWQNKWEAQYQFAPETTEEMLIYEFPVVSVDPICLLVVNLWVC